MSKQQEWEQIEKFIADNDFPNEFEWEVRPAMLRSDWVLWNQLNALWTVFCIHHDLELDTKDYDHRVMSMWNLIGCEGDFGDFNLFMCQYLC